MEIPNLVVNGFLTTKTSGLCSIKLTKRSCQPQKQRYLYRMLPSRCNPIRCESNKCQIFILPCRIMTEWRAPRVRQPSKGSSWGSWCKEHGTQQGKNSQRFFCCAAIYREKMPQYAMLHAPDTLNI